MPQYRSALRHVGIMHRPIQFVLPSDGGVHGHQSVESTVTMHKIKKYHDVGLLFQRVTTKKGAYLREDP